MYNENDIKRLLDIANAACHSGLALDARRIYDAVLSLKPDFVPAKLGMAYSHLTVDEFDKSLEYIMDVLNKNPEDEDAMLLLGLHCFLVGEKDKSVDVLQHLINSSSEHVKNLAQTLIDASK